MVGRPMIDRCSEAAGGGIETGKKEGPEGPSRGSESLGLRLGFVLADHELSADRQRIDFDVEAFAILVREGDADPNPVRLVTTFRVLPVFHHENIEASLDWGTVFVVHIFLLLLIPECRVSDGTPTSATETGNQG